MGPLLLNLMSILSQAPQFNRGWPGESMILRSGHNLFSNSIQPSNENNIGNGMYPIIVAIDSSEPKSRSMFYPNSMQIPMDTLPMSILPTRTSDRRDIPQTRSSLNPNIIQIMVDSVPIPSQSGRSPYARALPDSRSMFNPEIIPINMNDLPMYFQPEPKEISPAKTNFNPDILKMIMGPLSMPSQSMEDTEPKEFLNLRNTFNSDLIPISSFPMPHKSMRPEPREVTPFGFPLLDMLADIPQTSSPPPPLNEEGITPKIDSAASNNNDLLDFPMFNFGRSMDSLPMAVSFPVPSMLPPLVPALNITALTLCERSVMILSCPIGLTIHFVSSFYGRASKDICNPSESTLNQSAYNSTICNLPSAMNTLSNLCEGQNTCKMTVGNAVFGEDPCPGIEKYLQMGYYCR